MAVDAQFVTMPQALDGLVIITYTVRQQAELCPEKSLVAMID